MNAKRIGIAVAGAAIALSAMSFAAISPQEQPAANEENVKALAKSLGYFAKTQKADGSWDTSDPFEGNLIVPSSKRNDHYRAVDTRLFVAGMVGLCFISDGSTTQKGAYAANLRKALDFIHQGVANADFGKSNHGAFTIPLVAAFLSEMILHKEAATEEERTKCRRTLEVVVKAIVNGQKFREQRGIWGYGYNEEGGRTKEPASCASLMGLLIARDAGVDVPQKNIDGGLAYIKSCAVPRRGDFAYQASNQAPDNYGGYARTAGALYCLLRTGEKDSDIFKAAQKWLKANHPFKDMEGHKGSFVPLAFFFGALYMNQTDPAERDRFFKVILHDMITGEKIENENQKEDGTWYRRSAYGPLTYKTAMRALALAISRRTIVVFNNSEPTKPTGK